MLRRVQPAREPGVERLTLDPRLQLVVDAAAGALGGLLVGDQDVVDEAPRARLEVELLGGQLEREPGVTVVSIVLMGLRS